MFSSGAAPDPDLHGAIAGLLEDGAVRAVYQPVVRLLDGAVIGYEALARMQRSSLLQENPAIARKIYLQAIRRLYEDNQRGLQ